MTRNDYYTILGVEEGASQEALKRAYRELAKKYHPDRNPGDAEAERRFKEVQEAYDVLGDPEKRAKYDNLRRAGPGGFGGINLEDLFGGGGGPFGGGRGGGGSIFDLFERAGFGGGAARRRKGEDLRYEVTVPFETAAFGGKTSIRVPRDETCSACGGGGAAPGTSAETCPACRGTGTSAESQGAFSFSRPCPRCYGQGRIIANPCPACGGRGERRTERHLEVKIPAGIADGGKIRLRGEGGRGSRGMPPGDLILTVHVRGHGTFRRNGLDIESDLEIDVASAALGTTREVETLSGVVTLKVPAGVQPGARLRLKGRGVRDHRGRTGHHYVRIRVRIPKKLTAKQRKLLEELAKEL